MDDERGAPGLTVVVRSIHVGTRVADQVTGAESGDDSLLPETQMGRFLLDSDAKLLCMLFAGRRHGCRHDSGHRRNDRSSGGRGARVLGVVLSDLRSLGLVKVLTRGRKSTSWWAVDRAGT